MIHGITPDARCPYGMSFKLQRPVYGYRSNTRKSRLQFSHFLPMNRYFHVIPALILVVNNSRALGLLFFEFDAKVWGISWVVKKKAWSFVVDHKRPQMTTNGIEKWYNKKGIR